MTTFHSRQSDCARRVRKNENADTFNFTSQIAPSICTVMFTKRDKPGATIFKSRCNRTVVCYRFYTVEALPLVRTRFLRLANSSPKTARSPARRSRDGRETSGKTSGEISAQIRATSRQWPDSGNGNAAERPSRRLARQLALRRMMRCPRRKLARQRSRARPRSRKHELASNLNHDIQKL